MKVWMFLMMLVSAAAAAQPKDMSGKMFTFPEETNTAHVKLIVQHDNNFKAFTVCHRSITDLTRDHSLFSMASKAKDNEVLVYFDSRKKQLTLSLHNFVVGYGGLDYAPNKWHSICTTWNVTTGAVQLWFNGMPLIKKFVGYKIDGKPSIILGQEQDNYGNRFDKKQSFVGMMTDVHMWDREISPCDIRRYVEELRISPGNVINWAALDFQTQGRVFVEDKQVNSNAVCLM